MIPHIKVTYSDGSTDELETDYIELFKRHCGLDRRYFTNITLETTKNIVTRTKNPIQIETFGIKTIDKYAFYDLIHLTTVILSDDVEYILDHAFTNCQSLKSVNLPKKLKYISSKAF